MKNEAKNNKIAIFMASLRGGGVERSMLTLADCFVRQGFEVDLLLVSAEGPYLEEVTPGIKTVDFKASRVFFSIFPLARYLRQEKPAALLSAMSHVNIAAVSAKKLSAVPVRLVLSERVHLSRASQNSRFLKGRLMPFMVKFFYKGADLIVAISRGVKDDLLKRANLPEHKVRVIYNPVVTGEMIKKAEEPVEHNWFRDSNIPVILGVGRLSKQKEFATLIRAFKHVLEKRPAKLVILGEGEERANLNHLIASLDLCDHVCMPGFKANPYAYMSKASLFVLSSSWEGLGNVLIQAMACGCPVISTDCPSGPAEILDNGKYAPLIPVGDVEALAQAIINVLQAPPDPEALRERASFYSAEDISRQYLELLLS